MVMILLLIAVIFGITIDALRQVDNRVLALCKALAHLEECLPAWPRGMRDDENAEFLTDYSGENDNEQR